MNLTAVGPNVWIADGPSVKVFGPLTLPTRMIVIRLSDGSLWINSPIEASPSEMEQVGALGRVAHLVSPTPLHDWRLSSWEKAFPDALAWPRRRLAADPPQAWAAEIDQTFFEGSLFWSEVEFLHRESRTLIMADFIQNYPKCSRRPLLDAATRVAGVQGGGVPIDIRLSFVHRSRGRDSLRRLLAWDFDRLILAHGDCVESGAEAFVRAAFRWLNR